MPSRCRFLLIALAMLPFLSAAVGPGMAGTWKFELDFRDHPSLSYSEDGKLIFVLACGRAFGLHAKYPGKAEKSGTATIVLRNGRTAMKFVGELGEAGGNDLTDFEQWDLGFSRQDPELYGKRWKRLRSRLLDLIAAAAPLTISNGRESYDLPKVDAPNWRAPRKVRALGQRRPVMASLRYLSFLAAAVAIGAGAAHGGCPNDYHKLNEAAEQVTNAFNAASAGQRCARAAELVRIERKLADFAERFQIQCVLDQEVLDVQRRRLGKAVEAHNEACGRTQ